MKYIQVYLIRPRSKKYAHPGCMTDYDQDMFAERLKVIPVDDAELLGPCLLCSKSFAIKSSPVPPPYQFVRENYSSDKIIGPMGEYYCTITGASKGFKQVLLESLNRSFYENQK